MISERSVSQNPITLCNVVLFTTTSIDRDEVHVILCLYSVLLASANLSLVCGRRYGVVGRNGE